MKILAIETSCDETALAILECEGGLQKPRFKLVAETVASQIELHKQYGGVFPAMAKREHARNLVPLLIELLQKANLYKKSSTLQNNHSNILKNIGMVLTREPDLLVATQQFLPDIEKPPIDAIAVTYGPGLEPALWVGINFARALSFIWNMPVLPTNHMEGHLCSVLLEAEKAESLSFPLVALLVSGGHTELIHAKDWFSYSLIGETRDDAVGEAFDKVARVLGLPYPGGPKISVLADEARAKSYPQVLPLPRPMINSQDYDFSFSGIKTAVLYGVKKLGELSHEQKASIACEFEEAAIDVLIEKTKRALLEYSAQTLVIGGGVVANKRLRERFNEMIQEMPGVTLLLPEHKLSTDNAVMIGMAAYIRVSGGDKGLKGLEVDSITAKGTLSLHS